MTHLGQMVNILFITLEYTTRTFSGNGVHAAQQVKALCTLGHTVLVLSSYPAGSIDSDVRQSHIPVGGSYHLVEVPVPEALWGKLDPSSPWKEFAAGLQQDGVVEAVRGFHPQVAMVVDWTGQVAWRGLKEALHFSLPSLWLTYRVFTRTETGEGLQLVRRWEADALQDATLTVSPSRVDKQYLLEHLAPAPPAPTPRISVLLPALRPALHQLPLPKDVDMEQVYAEDDEEAVQGACCDGDAADPTSVLSPRLSAASTASSSSQQCTVGQGGCTAGPAAGCGGKACVASRPYLTCVVRLAKEKEPFNFVHVVRELAQRGVLQELQLTPFLVAAANDEYAQSVKAAMREAWPGSIVHEEFMSADALAQLFSRARLNIHPSTYDAFGMTIAEAASQACPSIVHDAGDNAVGATDLLRATKSEIVTVDWKAGGVARVADAVEQLLRDPARLQHVSQQAAHRARSWDALANGQGLAHLALEALGAAGAPQVLASPQHEEL